jgi:hypothetical protein
MLSSTIIPSLRYDTGIMICFAKNDIKSFSRKAENRSPEILLGADGPARHRF